MSAPSENIVKSSVHASTGINKSLLTPCRRIGLSRKSKPAHKMFNSPLHEAPGTLEVSSSSPQSLSQNKNNFSPVDNSKKNTAPQVKDFVSLRKKEASVIEVEQRTGDDIDSVKTQGKKLQVSSSSPQSPPQNKNKFSAVDNSKKNTAPQVKDFVPLRKKEEASIIEVEQRTGDDIDSVKTRGKKLRSKATATPKNTTGISHSTIIKKKSESIEWIDHLQRVAVEEEQGQPAQAYTPPKITPDVLKQLQSNELKVWVKRMDPLQSVKRKSVTAAPHRKVKRKLSLKKSTDSLDNCSSDTDDEIGLFKRDFSSGDVISEDATDSNDCKENISSAEVHEKEDTSSLIAEILQLEKRVHEKEVHLSKLQQAEVYHNIHNVEDLDKVTSTWKSKCEEALRDLLEKLREHACLDMSSLLKNLNVPSNLINYNSEEDAFV